MKILNVLLLTQLLAVADGCKAKLILPLIFEGSNRNVQDYDSSTAPLSYLNHFMNTRAGQLVGSWILELERPEWVPGLLGAVISKTRDFEKEGCSVSELNRFRMDIEVYIGASAEGKYLVGFIDNMNIVITKAHDIESRYVQYVIAVLSFLMTAVIIIMRSYCVCVIKKMKTFVTANL